MVDPKQSPRPQPRPPQKPGARPFRRPGPARAFTGRRPAPRGAAAAIQQNQQTSGPPQPTRPGIRHEEIRGLQHLTPSTETPKLKVYALGGLEEVGRNCTVFECGDDIVIVDVGMMFPEEGMPGIDYIIPNVTSLRGKEKNIRGIIITHGHLDHTGAIPLVVNQLGYPPIFTAPLSAGLIRKRQEEFGNVEQLKIQSVTSATKIALGKHFVFEPFHVNHNISDAFGMALHTPYGTIIGTGDFKFDFTPINEEPADLTHIAMFGARGVLALMSDSTNAESPGSQISERTVGAELDRIFAATKGRLIVATFSSLLTRVQQLITLSEKYGRRVLLQGRSMNNNVELAHSLGYMSFKPGTLMEEHELHQMPDEKVTVIGTGAQGERYAMLMRVANKEHRLITLKPNDSVLFSSSAIPGNERTIQRLKDTLIRQGAKLYHYQNLDVHSGGHAKQEELKLMMRLIKPKYFIPIHGNRFMLETHGQLAQEVGIPKENVFVADNGQIMEFDAQGARLTEDRVNTDYVMVDGLGVGDVSDVVLRDRVMLAEDGIFVVIATIDKRTGALVGSPDIISRGFVYMKENKELIERARLRIKKTLKDHEPRSQAFDEDIRNKIRNDMGQFLFQATKRRPMILPVIIEV